MKKNFLTIVQMVHHHPHGDNPESMDHRSTHVLESEEQIYQRRDEVDGEWRELDFGWLKHRTGMMILVNEERTKRRVGSVREEPPEIAAKVLEVRQGNKTRKWLVPAGQNIRVFVDDTEGIHIRCRSGIAQYTLIAFPK